MADAYPDIPIDSGLVKVQTLTSTSLPAIGSEGGPVFCTQFGDQGIAPVQLPTFDGGDTFYVAGVTANWLASAYLGRYPIGQEPRMSVWFQTAPSGADHSTLHPGGIDDQDLKIALTDEHRTYWTNLCLSDYAPPFEAFLNGGGSKTAGAPVEDGMYYYAFQIDVYTNANVDVPVDPTTVVGDLTGSLLATGARFST